MSFISVNLLCYHFDQAVGYPGRPGVATGFPLFAPFFTLQRIEVSKSVTLNLHFFQAHLYFILRLFPL